MRIAESIIHKPSYLSYRELDGEGVLYDTRTNSMHVLNKTALLIWNLCDEEEDSDGIARRIAGKYGIPESQALPDVLTCLRKFEQLGIIERIPQ